MLRIIIKHHYSGAYLTDEKRPHIRHNLATTISITPIHGGTDKGCFGDLLLVMNSTLPASGDHLGRTIGDLTAAQRFRLPRYGNTNPNSDHWNSQLTTFLRHIDQTKGYYCFVDVHVSSNNLNSLNAASAKKSKLYHAGWNRFLACDDPGDCELKSLYESVAQHHP